MGRNQHIVPHKTGWAVKSAGGERASSVHTTQLAAIERGRETARSQKTELLVHGRNGQIRQRDSYGNDDFPPQG